ncbi:MAG: H-NS histone family protein [Candidatus Competibacteraceae bacterium]
MNAVVEQINLSLYSIEELKTLVDRAKKEITLRERHRLQEVRDRIEQLASGLNMSLEEVMGQKPRSQPLGKARTIEIRFRNPANPAQTWTGRGKRPRWLQQALEQGARLEDFTVHE